MIDFSSGRKTFTSEGNQRKHMMQKSCDCYMISERALKQWKYSFVCLKGQLQSSLFCQELFALAQLILLMEFTYSNCTSIRPIIKGMS